MLLKIFVILCVFVVFGYTKRLPFPSYINRCSLSAPDFDECCIRNGKDAIKYVLKGDKKYDIPNMLPLVIPSISLETGPDFSLKLFDFHVSGLDKIELNGFRIDAKKQTIHLEVFVPQIDMSGKYNVQGKILVIPIQGEGDIHSTTIGCTVDYSCDYILKKIDGEEYLVINNATAVINMKKGHINLTNLFNGNKELGDRTNQLLNDDWEQVVDTLKPVLGETIVKIANVIINGITSHVPFKEIFLE